MRKFIAGVAVALLLAAAPSTALANHGDDGPYCDTPAGPIINLINDHYCQE